MSESNTSEGAHSPRVLCDSVELLTFVASLESRLYRSAYKFPSVLPK